MDNSMSLHDHGTAFVESMEQINRKIRYFTEVELRKASGTADIHKARKTAIDNVIGLAQGDERFKNERVHRAQVKAHSETVKNALSAAHQAKLSGVPLDEEPIWSLITDTYFGMLPSQERDPVRLAVCFENLNTKKVRDSLSNRQKTLMTDRSNRESVESYQTSLTRPEAWKGSASQKCGLTPG